MAEDTFQPDLWHDLDSVNKVLEFRKRQAQTSHPGVEFKVHWDRFARSNARCCVRHRLRIFDARYGRSKSVTQGIFFFAAKRAHQNEDATSNPSIAQGHTFVGGGYAKPRCAFLFESQCAGFCSVSIGVA